MLNSLERYAEAISDLDHAMRLAPQDPRPKNNLAWLLSTCADAEFRDPGRAVRLAREVVNLAGDEGAYWEGLGVALCRVAEWKEAIVALTKSMDLRKGGTSSEWFFLSMAHWHLGDKEDARRWHDKAVTWMESNKPDDKELKRFRAEAQDVLGIKKD